MIESDRTVDQIQSGCGDSYPTSSPTEPGAQSKFLCGQFHQHGETMMNILPSSTSEL